MDPREGGRHPEEGRHPEGRHPEGHRPEVADHRLGEADHRSEGAGHHTGEADRPRFVAVHREEALRLVVVATGTVEVAADGGAVAVVATGEHCEKCFLSA